MRFLPLLIGTGLVAAAGFYWLSSQLPDPSSQVDAPKLKSTNGKWAAFAGDRVQLDEIVLRLQGVNCPQLGTEGGDAAKEALGQIMSAGVIDCRVLDTKTARCSVAGRDLSDAVKVGGLCN